MCKLNFVLCLTILCGLAASERILGGPQPVTDATELAELRQNVMNHLKNLGAQPNGAHLEFVKFHRATSKVVAGVLYEISAEIKENNQNVNCTLDLWEKSWQDFVKLNIECGEEKRKYEWTSDQTEPSTK